MKKFTSSCLQLSYSGDQEIYIQLFLFHNLAAYFIFFIINRVFWFVIILNNCMVVIRTVKEDLGDEIDKEQEPRTPEEEEKYQK